MSSPIQDEPKKIHHISITVDDSTWEIFRDVCKGVGGGQEPGWMIGRMLNLCAGAHEPGRNLRYPGFEVFLHGLFHRCRDAPLPKRNTESSFELSRVFRERILPFPDAGSMRGAS